VNWALYALAAFLILGALSGVLIIGKPRKPMTPGAAAWVLVLNAGWAVELVIAARRLS
jgi:hypothetical protein